MGVSVYLNFSLEDLKKQIIHGHNTGGIGAIAVDCSQNYLAVRFEARIFSVKVAKCRVLVMFAMVAGGGIVVCPFFKRSMILKMRAMLQTNNAKFGGHRNLEAF